MKHIRLQITNWYSIHKRQLPWRSQPQPYKVWLSEIILQQTRIIQGLAYYQRFLENYPTVQHLAEAPIDDVLKLWQGLGYYSRAHNLHFTANDIVSNYNGEFPKGSKNLLKLKGVGAYTAAAISSICYNEAVHVVDGNVYRVIARIFGIDAAKGSKEGEALVNELAAKLLDKNDPGTFNQAIMEFGALQCKPKSPDCEACPVKNKCYAFGNNKVDLLPVKKKSKASRNRFFSYIIICCDNKIAIQQRDKSDIWKNLYEFPLIESEKQTSIEELIDKGKLEIAERTELKVTSASNIYKHVLSHQNLFCQFIKIEVNDFEHVVEPKLTLIIPISELGDYAIPRVIDKYLEENRI